jgi:hypothetical protein
MIRLKFGIFLSLLGATTFNAASGTTLTLLPKLFTAEQVKERKLVSESSAQLTEREEFLINHVKTAISLAEKNSSKLSSKVLAIDGMSNAKIRHLLNNLVKFPKANYLEVGVWKGSTFISALYGNKKTLNSAIAIDNWSEFGGPFKEFEENCNSFISDIPYQFYSQNSFTIDLATIITTPINVYLYDGHHSVESQEKAFTYYDKFFDDVFIAIVDDWNWKVARRGTFNAFSKLNYNVLYEISLPSLSIKDSETWYNGYYVAVIRKPNRSKN